MHEPQSAEFQIPQAKRSSTWRLFRRLLNYAAFAWKELSLLVLNLIAALIFTVAIVLLIEVLTESTVIVDSMIVPKSLHDDGYTEEVASRRLKDALIAYEREAQTKQVKPA